MPRADDKGTDDRKRLDPAVVWRPVRSRRASRASGEVVEQMLAAFFAGMRPGDWFGTEPELAQRFGVSRITIRDAVRELEARGMIEVKVGAGGGLRVAPPDPARYREALAIQLHLMGVSWQEVRDAQWAIEPLTARLAAEHATAEEVAELQALIDEARDPDLDAASFTHLALRFHLAIAAASGNRVLAMTLAALRDMQHREFEPSSSPDNRQRVLSDHQEICDAIAARDGERASELMVEHLRLVLGVA